MIKDRQCNGEMIKADNAMAKWKYSDSQCCWKIYSDFGGGKKISDSEFLSYNLMLNSGEKKIFQLSRCPKKIILNQSKNHNPPSKLNDRSLTIVIVQRCLAFKKGLNRSLDLD
jgi:hypothetical protein